MIKYITGLFLVAILMWTFAVVQAESSFYDSLVSKIGVLHTLDGRLVQYANVQYCNKIVSVTAEHTVKLVLLAKPQSKIIIKDEEFDLAIFERLGPEPASPLVIKLPNPFEIIYIPTYFWVQKTNVVYQSSVIGYLERRTLVQNFGFFGMSGSGAYNSKGEYVGPTIRMFTAPGFDIPELPEATTEQQVGIIGIGRTDRLIEMFTKEVCSPMGESR